MLKNKKIDFIGKKFISEYIEGYECPEHGKHNNFYVADKFFIKTSYRCNLCDSIAREVIGKKVITVVNKINDNLYIVKQLGKYKKVKLDYILSLYLKHLNA